MLTLRSTAILALSFLVTVTCPARGDESTEALWNAARGGDLPAIEVLLAKGIDVNSKNEYGATALSFASDKGHLPVVKYLLSKGADPNVTDTFYKATPMTWATQNEHLAVAVELAVHGAEGIDGVVLSVAASGDTELLDRLIKTGKCSSGSLTRALMAAKETETKTIAMLTEAGARPIAPVPAKLLDEYAGTYQLQPGFILDVRRDDDKLMAQLTGQPEFQIYAESESKFFWTVVEATLTFERDDEKKVVRAVLRQMGRTMPAERVENKPVDAEAQGKIEKYVGVYESKEGDAFRVDVENGVLMIGADGGKLNPLRIVSDHVFQPAQNPAVTVTFTVDDTTSAATGYTVDRDGEVSVRTRVKDKPEQVATALTTKTYPRTAPSNWSSFRGNGASGVADGQAPPTNWNAESGDGVAWKTPIPGLGLSSPVVWGNRVFVTTAVGATDAEFRAGPYGDVKSANDDSVHEWRLYCLDAESGKVRWVKTAHKGMPRTPRHTKASQANCSPAVTSTHVVVNFGSEGLYAYDHQGKQLWKRDLGILDAGWFYDATYQWGFSSSPVIHDGLVIVQADLNSTAFIAAFDLTSGSEVWRTPREEIPSWGTPTIVESGGRVQVVTNSSKHIYGYDLRSGKELWRLSGNSEVTVGTPIFGHDLMFFTGGYTPFQPIYAVKVGASGDISLKDDETANDHVAWSTRRGGTYMPTPIIYEDYLYTCANQGILSCYNAKTGERMYRTRIAGGKAGSYTASPVAADGKLYFSSEASGVFVVKAGPTYELLAENEMDGLVLATPAISDGRIFLRTQHHVIAASD